MLDGNAPITFGLIAVIFVCVSVVVGVLIWFWGQAKGFRDEIVELIQSSEKELKGALDAIKEKNHEMELSMAKMRSEIAETYMTKASAGVALDRLTGEISALRNDVGTRLGSIETYLRNGHS